MDHFIKLYKKKKGKDLRKDVRAVQKLRREVEKAKRALSAAHQVNPFLKTDITCDHQFQPFDFHNRIFG